MRERGFNKVNVRIIEDLENELSARWQSLDEERQLVANLEPQVRNAYVGLWETHRRTFGYTLLAELPYRAGDAIEDFALAADPIDLLIVDEYQDLNEADIKLIRLLKEKGARVLAVGDDDQSIYGFRMAAPEGIRRFHKEFGNCEDYMLTISLRCGKRIIGAATMLIETAPDRPPKPSLSFNQGAAPGEFLYLRFNNEKGEVEGVADLVRVRSLAGVPFGEIAILVRSQVDTWTRLLIPALTGRGVKTVSTDWIELAFQREEVRRGLARLRLVVEQTDSLAWWTLLNLQKGISQGFCDYIYGVAHQTKERFGKALLRLHPDFPGAPTANSARAASRLINQVLGEVRQMNPNEAERDDEGWA